MKNIKKAFIIATLSILVAGLASCAGSTDQSPLAYDKEVVETHTVKFYNYKKDEVLFETKVKEHATAEYLLTDESLERNDDAYHSYVFKNWVKLDSNLKETKNCDLTNITEDTCYAPIYEQGDRYYNVTFYADEKGKTILEQYTGENAVKAGSKVVCSKVPEKENTVKYNYSFKYWDKKEKLDCVLEDLEVYPVFDNELKTYTVTFYADEQGNEILEQYTGETAIIGGESCTCTKTPVKQNTQKYTYTFKQWDKKEELKYVNQNLEVYPIFDETINYYNVIFYADEEGTQILEEYVDENAVVGGSYVTCTKTPTKEKDKMCSYVFKQWDKKDELKCVSSNLEVYPVFTSILNKYSVTFYDADGTLLYENPSVNAGTKVVYPELEPTPSRQREEFEDYTVTYEFDCWSLSNAKKVDASNEMDCLLGDLVVYATYKETIVKSPRLLWIEHLKQYGTTTVDSDYYYVNMNTKQKDNPYYIGFNTSETAKKFNLHKEMSDGEYITILDFTFEFKTSILNGFSNGTGKVTFYKSEGNSTDYIHNINFNFSMTGYNVTDKNIGSPNLNAIKVNTGVGAILSDKEVSLYTSLAQINCTKIMTYFNIYVESYCDLSGLPFVR